MFLNEKFWVKKLEYGSIGEVVKSFGKLLMIGECKYRLTNVFMNVTVIWRRYFLENFVVYI